MEDMEAAVARWARSTETGDRFYIVFVRDESGRLRWQAVAVTAALAGDKPTLRSYVVDMLDESLALLPR